MNPNPIPRSRNGETVPAADIPRLSIAEFRSTVVSAVRAGARIAALFGVPAEPPGREEPTGAVQLYAVLAHDAEGDLSVLTSVVRDSYPALTPECPQAHWFEREIAEQWAIRPEGHPWLKPIRFHRSYRPGFDGWQRGANDPILPSVTDFFRVSGEEVHEVAVGPVHAGIIEPGHFRFQCHGETVMHLEISLGYQHRGVEATLVGGPAKRTVYVIETASGDSSVGHALAYCEALESLAGCAVPPRAQSLRGVALELERLANHTGDLGALAGDVGFLPTASYCGRIRGDLLNMTALVCGNRFGRGWIRPGGVGFDVDSSRVEELLERLERARTDVTAAVNLLWDSSSVLSRFEGTGTISQDVCTDLGLVGVAARACGLAIDDRYAFPTGVFRFAHVPVLTLDSGDVFARAYVRWLEMQQSFVFVRSQLRKLDEGPVRVGVGSLAPESFVVSLSEGWRGEICHAAVTDSDGRFLRYKIVDPSFHNWMGLAIAMRSQEISDFPLCNKSFNLSYCGHDL